MPTSRDARASIGRYIGFDNGRRQHSSLDGKAPEQAYFNPLTPVSVVEAGGIHVRSSPHGSQNQVDSAAKCNRGIEADCKVFSKSIEEGLCGRLEAEAFSGREVQCHGDVLNVFVTEVVEIG